MSRILVVDDELQIRKALDVNLRAWGHEVELAATGEEALAAATTSKPELILLDLGLPGMSGLDVIDGVRGWSDVPIIVLSARESDRDKVAALDAGADDYVTKPFSMNELMARVRASLRRHNPAPEDPIVETPDFCIDLAARRVTRDGASVHLTPTEWAIVEYLVRNAGRLVTQRQLLQRVWGPQYENETNYLRVHFAAIRRKLEPNPSQPRYFITEPGIGHRFEPVFTGS
jgi:two-component system KDP operon response regulator KdpE